MGIYIFIIVLLAGLFIPALLCFVNIKYPKLFNRLWKLLLWAIGYSLFSWGYWFGAIFIPSSLDLYSIRGPELAYVLFFGWLYQWVISIPVFIFYSIVKLILHFNPIVKNQSYPCGFIKGNSLYFWNNRGCRCGAGYPFGFIKFNKDAISVGSIISTKSICKIPLKSIVNVSIGRFFFRKMICIETNGIDIPRYFFISPVGNFDEVYSILRDLY